MVAVPNLIRREWDALPTDELRILLQVYIGGPGQISGVADDDRFYLPLAGEACQLAIRFDGTTIKSVEAGPAFDGDRWARIAAAIDERLTGPASKFGRNIAFAGRRVNGWWRGERSRVQISPPPPGAALPPVEIADHPFILEFPIHPDVEHQVLNHRRLKTHLKLSLLLNVLLQGGVKTEPRITSHAWSLMAFASSPERCLRRLADRFQALWSRLLRRSSQPKALSKCAWLQQSYHADIGPIWTETQAEATSERLENVEPTVYYEQMGHDGTGLKVPSDLDDSIMKYAALDGEHLERFDRALYWFDMSARHWNTSMAASFAELVTAIEAHIDPGTEHPTRCEQCKSDFSHRVPGAGAAFRSFFDTYAPGTGNAADRNEIYRIRSKILHGGGLTAFDEGRAVGWDPPWSLQEDLHRHLWRVTRLAIRNYLAAHGHGAVPR